MKIKYDLMGDNGRPFGHLREADGYVDQHGNLRLFDPAPEVSERIYPAHRLAVVDILRAQP